MTKLKQIIAITLVMCSVLAGCGKTTNVDKAVSDISSTTLSASDSQAMIVGRWEGTGNFDSYAKTGEECNYILDFFEDGKMAISSPNLHFYGVDVPNMSLKDETVEFNIPYNNPLYGTNTIPINEREMMQIKFFLQVTENELVGKATQGQYDWGITFKKISEEPKLYVENDTLTKEQMMEDADVLFDILENKHPNIFYVQSQEEYQKQKSKFIEKIPSLDNASFYFEICRLLAFIGDAHTGISYNESLAMSFPIEIDYFSGKWYIVKATEQYEDLIGNELVSINGIAIDEVFTKSTEILPHENMAYMRKVFAKIFSNVEFLTYAEIVNNNQTTIVVKDNQLGNKSVDMSAIKMFDNDTVKYTELENLSETAYQSDVTYMYKPLDQDIFYIQYNLCYENDEYPIEQFGEDVAKALSDKKYKKIVVDLRNNGGGNFRTIQGFIQPILDAKNNGAQVYCLIGGNTFSAAFINALELQKQGVPLVGQPTGGNMQHFTEVSKFQLPNSRFKGQYSTMFVNYDENAPYDSLYPDKQIDHTIEAYINGIDEEIEYIKKQ